MIAAAMARNTTTIATDTNMRQAMRAVNPDYWRRAAEAKEAKGQNAGYERRQQVLAVTRRIQRETKMPPSEYWLRLIHEHRLRLQGAVEHALLKIGDDNNWDERCLCITFLKADIVEMRKIADAMERTLATLTTPKSEPVRTERKEDANLAGVS